MQIQSSILSNRSRSLQIYFNEINRIALLTSEQEVALIKKIRQGDLAALERLTNANLRFVVAVAKQYQHKSMGLPVEDLINEGNLGLIKAAQRYDETKGFKFISYAVWWIRQSILKAISEQSRLVRLPVNRISDISKIRGAFAGLEQEYEREPTNEELSEILEMEKEEIASLRGSESPHVSLDAPIQGATENETTLLDFIAKNGIKIDSFFANDSLKKDLQRVISTLNEKQQIAIKLYFGIDNDRPLNLVEIAEHMGLTRERVRQLKEGALKSMRKNGKANLLRHH